MHQTFKKAVSQQQQPREKSLMHQTFSRGFAFRFEPDRGGRIRNSTHESAPKTLPRRLSSATAVVESEILPPSLPQMFVLCPNVDVVKPLF